MILSKSKLFIILFLSIFLLQGCNSKCADSENYDLFLQYAKSTFNNTYTKYGVEDEVLLREIFPFDKSYTATYLDGNAETTNPYAYLWPYSGSFSAANTLFKLTSDPQYMDIIENKVLPGLEEYFDTSRHPFGYASYINRAPLSDRFYDDNIWIGIDFVDLYETSQKPVYLEKAEEVWKFVYSGHDDLLDGGIYWVEQNKGSKHSCSNAPAAVLALKLYEATKKKDYFEKAVSLYNWTKTHLQDKEDLLYYDNIRLDGTVDKKKYSYNSGQMLQAAAMLYRITKEQSYLDEAETLAAACYNYFFHDFADGDLSFRMLNRGDVWFSAVMSRGFIELYSVNKDTSYLQAFNKNLKYAWEHMKDENGLFGADWTGNDEEEEKRWLLVQMAMVEMYARFACVSLW